MKGFAITVLALAGAVAFLAPHTDPTVVRQPAPTGHTMAAQKQSRPVSYGGEMVLDRDGDGHFYATAQIEGRDYRMLVDTGATVVALTGQDAEAMGLTWNPQDLAPVVRGAGGPVMGVPVKIDDMAVGDFEARDVQAVIIPDGLAISLLGQSFLRQVRNVDIADDKLTLSD
jgi:aspartyl protease family protein